MKEKILVTGAAGFIGFHLTMRLLKDGYWVVGIDNLNDYYDPVLKEDRLSRLQEFPEFQFYRYDLADKVHLLKIFEQHQFDLVIHLAAQAGVRYSITNPDVYISTNIVGFHNIQEAIRANPVKHFIYASSSSVYGGNEKLPFSTDDHVDYPVSLYAATKKSNELMAHTYSHLYGIPSTGLRFFTVYGPWGRPDMALFKFAEKIVKDETIDIYNNGDMRRDFTYVDDVVESMVRLMPKVPSKGLEESAAQSKIAPYRIFNIGSHNPVTLMEYVDALERHLGKKARKSFVPMQPGDVKDTFADVSDLVREIDFSPRTSIDEGVGSFVKWYQDYRSKRV
ncbi:MAG: NAD-dependent epimerase [Marinoscillum sp.]|uniref:NAD-dependent epimerase n=1 Tax=Marinoscillum sp. TaxID=2024838 RepID=UPI0032F0C9BA